MDYRQTRLSVTQVLFFRYLNECKSFEQIGVGTHYFIIHQEKESNFSFLPTYSKRWSKKSFIFGILKIKQKQTNMPSVKKQTTNIRFKALNCFEEKSVG